MPSGAELFAQSLRELGINEIFTLVGDHLNEVLATSARAGIRIIDMRHESGVTHLADGVARLRRKPALSLVTGGPGHTNSVTGIATAYLMGSPLIAVSGSRASLMAGRQGFQDIDQVSMIRPVVKWAGEPASPAQIPFYLGRAYAEATAGRMGPTHLTISTDLFDARTDAPIAMPRPGPRPTLAPAPDEVERALRLLRDAERPVVVVGSGVWWADAGRELATFLKRTHLPSWSVLMGRGIASDLGRHSFGYADPALNKSLHTLFKEADACLVLGKRIDYRLALGGPRLFDPACKFVQVDIHAPELGANRALDTGICADVRATLAAFNEAIGKDRWKARPRWLNHIRAADDEWRTLLREIAMDRSTPLHPASFFAELARHIPVDTLYSWDGGDFTSWGRSMYPATHPGGWMRLGPMGTIGSSLLNGMALRMENPDSPVAVITGDGALGFYIAELETAAKYNWPMAIIVGNDAGWGLERELQWDMTGGRTVACDLPRTRYDIVMQGFGGEGETIDTLAQVGPAVKRAFRSAKPYLLNVNIRGARSPFADWQLSAKKK